MDLRTQCLGGCPVRTHQHSVEPGAAGVLLGPLPPPIERLCPPGPSPKVGRPVWVWNGPRAQQYTKLEALLRSPADALTHTKAYKRERTGTPRTQFKFFSVDRVWLRAGK